MDRAAVTLDQPISQFVQRQSRYRNVSEEETVRELITLGFETLLREEYERYRRGEIPFGRPTQELDITAWELSHLLEERGWPAHNLPTVA